MAQWWSIALPRRGSRVRIPSRAFINFINEKWGVFMPTDIANTYEGLNMEYRTLVDDFIKMLSRRQSNEDETLQVIRDARNGIGLSEAYENVDDFMEALNAED